MAPTSRRSSKSSLVSIDPAVATQITGSSKTASQAGHSRTESNPTHTTNTGSTLPSRSHGRTHSAPTRNKSKRSNSIKRAKNSTELLKARSGNVDRKEKTASGGDMKRGRNFTITNVSTGGVLQLRPSPHSQVLSSPTSPPHSAALWSAPAQPSVIPTRTEPAQPSQSVTTRTRSASPGKALGDPSLTRHISAGSRRGHARSRSFSTLDESRKSVSASIHPKQLKIVINRPESALSADEHDEEPPALPTLEIPIPHYKLGTPRFSAHGTPMLRSSGYTNSSVGDSVEHPSVSGQGSLQPPASNAKAFARIQQYLPPDSRHPYATQIHQERLLMRRASAESIELISPVHPEVFDDLSEVYNDPTVVKYNSSVRDIAAATKTRIIAQISSDSFMDYELVSDFFLTFRSYMSTVEVLDLLLARLEWAIGRFTDDGRIVRIRTFAALRHWILNYFVDDFVLNRRLRVRFCNEVNRIYDEVARRPRISGGASDLKILQDLKRCWNGRCALYWDAEEFGVNADQESPLLPGGVVGSRNPTYTDMNELNAASGGNLLNSSQQLPSPIPLSPRHAKIKHKRLPSSDSAKRPASNVGSENSIQPGSCSIPRSKSGSPDEIVTNIRGPHPVSVLSRRQNAPADLKVITSSRDGSKKQQSAQAGEEQATPKADVIPPMIISDPHAGSIIRGFVYGPVDPFVQLPSNPPVSPAVNQNQLQENLTSSSTLVNSQLVSQQPGMKNFIGSIRRAMGGKQGASDMAIITVSTPKPDQALKGRRSTVPPNLARPERKVGISHEPKPQVRIDLLCAAAVQSFQTIVPPPPNSSRHEPESAINKRNTALFSPPLSQPDENKELLAPNRLPSHYTARSGSILIVDDTGSDMHVMSGALMQSYTHTGPGSIGSGSSQGGFRHGDHTSFETQIAFQDDSQVDHVAAPRKLSLDIPHSEKSGVPYKIHSSGGSAITVTNQPANVRKGRLSQTSPPPPPETPSHSETYVADDTDTASLTSTRDPNIPPPALRRRPGGDLRKNQNVHDLGSTTHHESLDSMLESRSSAPDSLLIMANSPTPATPGRAANHKPKQVSMINTHSSQHLRPSFEAAVAGFSAIPDDDDGGLEATLLKLEGRYDKQSPGLSDITDDPHQVPSPLFSNMPNLQAMPRGIDSVGVPLRGYQHARNKSDTGSKHSKNPSARVQPLDVRPPKVLQKSPDFRTPSESVGQSRRSKNSQDSIPLLQRTSSKQGKAKKSPKQRPVVPSVSRVDSAKKRKLSTQRSRELDVPIAHIQRPETANTESGRSFLLDEDENLSDLSSEISVDIINYSDALSDNMSPMFVAPGTAVAGLEMPSHPLAHSSIVNLSIYPSPELTSRPMGASPLTPVASPILLQGANGEPVAIGKRMNQSTSRKEKFLPHSGTTSAHVPFILAYDSQVLAQQMTIVEQSALTEVEWTDLVEMRWSSRPRTVLDWAEFMTKNDCSRGIDLVISRTNLVVKWTLSEIVLTQDINERARVISKFIHMAAHARRLHNYATMLQITMALISNDCSRLQKTWDLVPGPDKSLLKNMEPLVNPLRNFSELRSEMESADLTSGCIPFIGLYTHDLTYNAQKPVEIEVEDDQEPLINFERFRTAASIIKGLLRLIDASSKYGFEPIHGIIERCLWMSALPDDKIRMWSKALE